MSSLLHPVYLALNPQEGTITSRAHGPDLSKYDLFFVPQGVLGQLDFVIQRISYRTTRDEAFDKLLPGVMQVNIRGGYHYLNSDRGWKEQADAFLSFVKPYDYHFFACDFEGSFNTLSTAFAHEAWQWIDYVQNAKGKPVLIYTSPSLYSSYLYPSQSKYSINWNMIPLWTAQWLFVPNPNGTPSMPAGRTTGWKFWQYTDKGHGPTYGVARPTACDLNVCNGSVNELAQWLKISNPIPQPPPTGDTMYGKVTASALNIRTGPGTTYQDIGNLLANDIVHASEVVSGWHHLLDATRNGQPVTLANGMTVAARATLSNDVWCSGTYIMPIDPPSSPPDIVYPDSVTLNYGTTIKKDYIPK